MSASQATAFLVTAGAKKINVYERAGRKPKLTWVLKGKTFGIDIEPDDLDSGASAIPMIRAVIANADKTFSAKEIRTPRDTTADGARLKLVREEATLKRADLAARTGIDAAVIKELEEKRLPFEGRATDEQIIALATACKADPNWLAGRMIVEPPPTAADIEAFLATPVPVEAYPEIAARMQARRKELKLNQVAVGILIGVSGATISQVEKGKPSQLWSALGKYASAIQMDEYMLRTGRPRPVLAEPVVAPPVAASEPVSGPVVPSTPEHDPLDDIIDDPDMEDYPAIGLRIRAARKDRGFSQTVLGEKLGYSGAVISTTENGRRTGVFYELRNVAKHLRLDPRWLVTGRDEFATRPTKPRPALVKAGQTARRSEPAASPQAVAAAPQTRAVAKAGVATIAEGKARSQVPAPIEIDEIAVLTKRFDDFEKRAMLRHEEMAAQTLVLLRYLKSIHHRLVVWAQQQEQTPKKRIKNPKRTEAGKRAWQARRDRAWQARQDEAITSPVAESPLSADSAPAATDAELVVADEIASVVE